MESVAEVDQKKATVPKDIEEGSIQFWEKKFNEMLEERNKGLVMIKHQTETIQFLEAELEERKEELYIKRNTEAWWQQKVSDVDVERQVDQEEFQAQVWGLEEEIEYRDRRIVNLDGLVALGNAPALVAAISEYVDVPETPPTTLAHLTSLGMGTLLTKRR